MEELHGGGTKGACIVHLWCSIEIPMPNGSHWRNDSILTNPP